MALPTTRNTTYTAASPIKSADLNALQDCVIGAKHPELIKSYSAAAFHLKTGGTATLGSGQWTIGAVSDLVADVSARVLEGTRITTVQWAYNRGGAGNIRLRLIQRNIISGAAAANVVAETVINAGTGWTTTTITYNYVIPADTAVWLEVQCDNVANIFGGTKLKHDRL